MSHTPSPVPPAESHPHFQVRYAGQLLKDLPPDQLHAAKRGVSTGVVVWTLAAIFVLMAVFVWLLVSPPLPR